MKNLTGKTAFITGGASGIGYAMAKVFAREGMNVMLADIEAGPLDEAARALRNAGGAIGTIVCDVADANSVAEAAQAAFDTFGTVHVVCNNAGVGGGSGIDDIRLDTWRWVIDVNLMGVVHGVAAFLPHMRAHGEGGHFVNTASMAGLNMGLGFSAYVASKFAVVAMSEGLAKECAPHDIGVTVLCPGFVRTRIFESSRNRPARYGAAQPAGPMLKQLAELGAAGLDPDDVAAQVLAAVRADELYVFTHAGPDWRAEVQDRFDGILSAMDRAASR